MILFSVGLPGRFAQWCDDVVAQLASRLGGEVAAATWPSLSDMFGLGGVSSTLDELARLMIGNTAQHLVIGVRQPDERLRKALAARDARFLLALDDPRNAAADILDETGADPKAVVRAVANSCPFVMPFEELPGALTIRLDDARSDPLGAISAIAAHFAIAVEPATLVAIAEALPPPAAWASPLSGEGLAERLPAATHKMIEGALRAYHRRFADGHLDQIVWTRDLFYLSADPSRSPTEAIEVGGGSRVLIHGPYIHLPPGAWMAQVVLGLSAETAASNFLVEAFAGVQLASTTFRSGAAGVYSAELTFSLDEASGTGVEVRVWVTNNDAAGRLAFGRIVLQPLVIRRGDMADVADFERVLDL